MTDGILFEKVESNEPPPGWYYAHLPALSLTTHGEAKDVPNGTFRRILKQAGLTEEAFRAL